MDLVPLIRDPALVRQHLLAPLAYRQGRAEYKRDYIAAALHAERRQAFLDEAVAALGPIPAMRLKGIAYAGTIYPDPARASDDRHRPAGAPLGSSPPPSRPSNALDTEMMASVTSARR
jgi:hypothetical protein